MTITNFKKYLGAYINRDPATLTSVDSQDIILQAMNDARRAAQRDHIFELNKTEDAYLVTHAGGVNWITGCKSTPGGSAIVMRRIDEVWTYGTSTINATSYYQRTSRIPFTSAYDFKTTMPVQGMGMQYFNNSNPPTAFTQNMFAYAQGVKLFITTLNANMTVKLVGIQWLEDLTGSEDPDIFLTFFTDWLLHATIAAMNIYMKDSERFPIDTVVLARLWESVKQMDGQYQQQGEAVSLD